MNLAGFMADRKTCDAVIRNLEVIGEACNNIAKNHPDFAAQHAAIPWGFAYEMRNALAHGYFTVDLAIVWKTIQSDLPLLHEQVSVLQTWIATFFVAACAYSARASPNIS